jgi:excisionase family DNA binding protein
MSHLDAERPLWTASQVALRLNVPVHRVYALARSNRLPCLRIGRTLRFDPEAILTWVTSGGWPSPSLASQKGHVRAES